MLLETFNNATSLRIIKQNISAQQQAIKAAALIINLVWFYENVSALPLIFNVIYYIYVGVLFKRKFSLGGYFHEVFLKAKSVLHSLPLFKYWPMMAWH